MLKLFLCTVALWLAAAPAYADPVTAMFAAISTVIKGSAILSAIAQIGVSLALTKIASKLGRKPQKQQTEVKFDIETGDDLPLSIILGTFATAGRRKYLGSWGRNTRFITDVIEVSCLPHPTLTAIWIGDEEGQIDTSKIGRISGDVSTAADVIEQAASAALGTGLSLGHPVQTRALEGRRRIWVRWVDGTQTTIDPFLSWAFGNDPIYPWAGIGLGKSYAIVTVQYDKDVLESYPNYLFQPAALPMYDPRKDGSLGGVGGHRWGDRASYEPSSNAAVIAYNIARGIYWGSEWIFGGRNLPAWRVPRGEWVAAMTACDRRIALAGGGTEPAYRCGREVSVDMDPAGVLEELGQAANMRFAEVGGRLKPSVDLPGAAVFSLTDGDIVITEGQSFTPFFGVSDTYNVLGATYPEPRERWASKDAPERIDAAGQALDGGRYLPTSVTYPACPFGTQVQRLMVSQLADYRRMRRHAFTLPPDAYALEPLDMISWTSARNGYVEKKFVIEEISKMPGFSVVVSVREVDPIDYSWHPSLQMPQVITAPVNPIPFTQGIFGWTALAALLTGNNGRGKRAAIVVGCGANEIGISEIRIQVERAGVVQFDIMRPYAAPHQWTLTDVSPETTYRVRGALISERTGRFTWSEWITVTTPPVSVWMEDLAAEIVDEIERLAAEGGIQAVDVLPASGERPDQIVLRRSDKRLFRWEAETGVWSDELYAGLADESITAAKIVAGAIVSSHIAANAILASHIGAGEVTADKIKAGDVQAVHLAAGAITTEKLATESIDASKLIKSQNLITETAQIKELILSTPLLAPNTISRVISVQRNGGGFPIGAYKVDSTSPYNQPRVENRTAMTDYLTGTIWAPYAYDLYFWVALGGANSIANVFRNGDLDSYAGYQFRTSLDTLRHPDDIALGGHVSGAMVGVIAGVSGSQSLTIAGAPIQGRVGGSFSNVNLTMMAVMR